MGSFGIEADVHHGRRGRRHHRPAAVAPLQAAAIALLGGVPAGGQGSGGGLLQPAAEIGLDGAEAFYDYTMGPAWQATPLVCEAIAADLSKRGLLLSCGTDTHGLALHGR